MMFSLHTWLKQHRITVGGVLFASAIAGCHASAKLQSCAMTPAVPSSSIVCGITLIPVTDTRVAAAETQPDRAVQVIRDYYKAISRRDYKRAYLAWDGDGARSQQSFEQFKQGFATTASAAVDVGKPGRLDGAAGSIFIKIPVTVTATITDGTQQRFRGSYVLRQVNHVPSSTSEQRRWHLYSANMNRVN